MLSRLRVCVISLSLRAFSLLYVTIRCSSRNRVLQLGGPEARSPTHVESRHESVPLLPSPPLSLPPSVLIGIVSVFLFTSPRPPHICQQPRSNERRKGNKIEKRGDAGRRKIYAKEEKQERARERERGKKIQSRCEERREEEETACDGRGGGKEEKDRETRAHTCIKR